MTLFLCQGKKDYSSDAAAALDAHTSISIVASADGIYALHTLNDLHHLRHRRLRIERLHLARQQRAYTFATA